MASGNDERQEDQIEGVIVSVAVKMKDGTIETAGVRLLGYVIHEIMEHCERSQWFEPTIAEFFTDQVHRGLGDRYNIHIPPGPEPSEQA